VLKSFMKKQTGNVYATDTILAVLMAAPRSVASWDVVVTKKGDRLVFDKRPNSKLDYFTVNENWNEVQQAEKDSINHPDRLSIEATNINTWFAEQVLYPDKQLAETKIMRLGKDHPLTGNLKEGAPASEGFRYRSWEIEDVTIVARTTVHGFVAAKSEKKNLLYTRALNQFDGAQVLNWKEKLENQGGAVLAAEIKNNTNKITRWMAEMHLAGAQEFRLGFVARKHAKDAYNHTILAVQRYSPLTFASTGRIAIRQLWGVLLYIIDACRELQDGKYLLMRDPNEPKLVIYSVPDDAFGDESGDPWADLSSSSQSAAK